ncbi:hypothetical protein RNZ50_06120 [Paracoccaceae bacterium Fryx2]|nr:hypothetical protein [Paracoccaceae bacterium Fryx2]
MTPRHLARPLACLLLGLSLAPGAAPAGETAVDNNAFVYIPDVFGDIFGGGVSGTRLSAPPAAGDATSASDATSPGEAPAGATVVRAPAGASVGLPGDLGATTISADATQRLVSRVADASRFCRLLPESAYAVDCLSEQLESIVRDMPTTGEYADARTALATAARDLRALAERNADPALPTARLRVGGQVSSRPLTPIRPEARASANQQAIAILEEAETVLLRSAENSARRRGHYDRVALAVGSNKLLLRSL